MHHSRYLKLFIFIVVFLFALNCKTESSLNNESSNFNGLTEINSIDNQTNIDKEYPIIPAISHATSDLHNNIYIAAPHHQTVHSFSDDLQYRWTVGGRGGGPGEYNSISSLFTTDSLLYVFDGPGSIINTYSLSTGEHLESTSLGESGHLIQTIHQNKSNQFVTTGFNSDAQTIVNIYSENFNYTIEHLVSLNQVDNSTNHNTEMQIARNYPGFSFPVDDSLIVYTPKGYDGKLKLYRRSDSTGWSNSYNVDGYKAFEEPRLIHFTDSGDHDRSHLSGFYPGGGYFHMEFKSMSFGIYPQTGDTFAHVSASLSSNDSWDLVVEFFDQSTLKLIEYSVIKNFIPNQQPQKLPIWMSPNGELFVTENSDTPLRIYQLSSDIDSED